MHLSCAWVQRKSLGDNCAFNCFRNLMNLCQPLTTAENRNNLTFCVITLFICVVICTCRWSQSLCLSRLSVLIMLAGEWRATGVNVRHFFFLFSFFNMLTVEDGLYVQSEGLETDWSDFNLVDRFKIKSQKKSLQNLNYFSRNQMETLSWERV